MSQRLYRPLQSVRFILLGVLLLAISIATNVGAFALERSAWFFWLDPRDLESVIVGQRHVLWTIRIPRVLFAGLIGACLGFAGALTQALFRNPLAEPGLLGVSSGAACAASLSIVFLAQVPGLAWLSGHWLLLPGIAFFGAVFVCLFLDSLSRTWMAGSVGGLLLTGIAVNALSGAVIGLCAYMATDMQLRSLTFWTLGSLANASWTLIAGVGGLFACIWIATRPLIQSLNALMLGESIARHVGVCLPSLRLRVILMVAGLAGFAVAFCGVIGFIGLAAPHLVRLVAGADLRLVLSRSAIVGAILLICADAFARTISAPAEVPVGIFTALLGSAFFFWLLARHRQGLA
jgi:iron complex transport system permease protein